MQWIFNAPNGKPMGQPLDTTDCVILAGSLSGFLH